MHTPLVSVVIPTHNRPHFLAQAIDSVRAQTFTDYEIIVVSNGERADPASRSIAAGCCRYFQLAEGNVSRARNFGVEQAHGEWIAFLDDDDLWLPTKLERQVAEAQSSGADVIACDYVEFHPDGTEAIRQPRLADGWPLVKALSWTCWYALPSATIVRKSVFGQIGGFDPRFRYGGEDTDMWRRISWRHTIHQVPEALIRYRQGHPSFMQNRRKRCFDDLIHYAKMRRDTPQHLRWALPQPTFVVGRAIAILVPQWLLLRLRPRSRLIALRAWLRPRTRLNALRYRLQIRTRARKLARQLFKSKP
jgi:glycosyltransferase involved in cell wall biosynthesis